MKSVWVLTAVALFGLLALSSGCEDPNPIEIFEDSLSFDERLAIEVDSMNQFIAEEGFEEVIVTESGLRLIPIREGNGNATQPGDILSVDFTGSFLYGPVFDTTIEEDAMEAGIFVDNRTYIPFVTNLGSDVIIEGWNEGLSLMEEGSEVILLIPSHLGYGILGRFPTIGPFRVLKFEMSLVRIRR